MAPLTAQAWVWDRNNNRIDDRIEAVNANGIAAAHVDNDLGKRTVFFVFPETASRSSIRSGAPVSYGVYVGYDHPPTDGDVAELRAAGATLLWRPRFSRPRVSFPTPRIPLGGRESRAIVRSNAARASLHV